VNRRPLSLHARLLAAALVVLTAFLGLTGAALDSGFRRSAEAAARDRLQAEIYLLLGSADADPDLGLTLPDILPDARLGSPGSGLYAEVVDGEGRVVWRSWSTLGVEIPFPAPPPAGHPEFQWILAADDLSLLTLSLGVIWEVAPGRDERYTFRVAETRATMETEVSRFRQSLWGWLAAAALALLAVQGVVLRWGLAPLRRVTQEVQAIEAGQQTALPGPYPRELRPLTDRLNGLLAHSRSQLERYRHALADLAHSLKTPLAVLRGAAAGDASLEDLRGGVREQVDRMVAVVDYQLHRAAASGRTPLTASVPLAATTRRVIASLVKVYADRGLRFEVEVADELRFAGDEADLMEVLGNLADNAAKWARSRVRVTASASPSGETVLTVEDDGPGIPEAQMARVLERGVRGDPGPPGQGIGLAVVRDIVEAYGGSLRLANREGGGLRVEVRVPG
jgi:two-component system sensor histidine kinase PhoQ